jgi:hypothetical protein
MFSEGYSFAELNSMFYNFYDSTLKRK